MSEIEYVESVDGDLEPIIPQFLENSHKELEQLRETLTSGDLVTLGRLGHSMKGAGLGFGFLGMGELGKRLEDAGKAGDAEQCADLVEQMALYLERVQVKYV